MYLEEIIDVLEKDVAPKEYSFDSEHYGIQYGIKKDETIINRILLSVDINLETINFALKKKINLIISHHGLIIEPILSFSRNLIKKLTLLSKLPIYVYILGSPFIAAKGGIADIIVEVIFLKQKELFYIKTKNNFEFPVGRICSPNFYLNKDKFITLENLLIRIKRNLHMKNISYIGNLNQPLNKILVFSQNLVDIELLEKIKENKCDCCICYRTNHIIANHALDEDIALIELSHFQVESLALNRLKNVLSLKFPYDEFLLFESEDPFKIF